MVWYLNDLDSSSRNLIYGHNTPFAQTDSVGEVWFLYDKGKKLYDPDKDFSDNSAIALTLDPITWFNFSAHTLTKGTL